MNIVIIIMLIYVIIGLSIEALCMKEIVKVYDETDYSFNKEMEKIWWTIMTIFFTFGWPVLLYIGFKRN